MIPGGPFGGDDWSLPPEGRQAATWEFFTTYLVEPQEIWPGLIPAPPSPSPVGPMPSIQFSPALTISMPTLAGVSWELAAWALRLTEMANAVLAGKLNATLDFTITPNADSTTIADARIGVISFLQWMPKNLAAATEMAAGGMFIQSQTNGQAVVAHSNSGTPNRYFRLLIIG